MLQEYKKTLQLKATQNSELDPFDTKEITVETGNT